MLITGMQPGAREGCKHRAGLRVEGGLSQGVRLPSSENARVSSQIKPGFGEISY